MSSDSSTSRPALASTIPSTGTWSPGGSVDHVVEHHLLGGDLDDRPSRTTATCGALTTASRSRVRLARTSWTMPMSELATITMPNSASLYWPVSSTTTTRTVRMTLNRVKTLARTMSPTVRRWSSVTTLTQPPASRSRDLVGLEADRGIGGRPGEVRHAPRLSGSEDPGPLSQVGG